MKHTAIDNAADGGTVVRMKHLDAHVATIDVKIQIVSTPLHRTGESRRSLKIGRAQHRHRGLRLIGVTAKIESRDRRVHSIDGAGRRSRVQHKSPDACVAVIIDQRHARPLAVFGDAVHVGFFDDAKIFHHQLGAITEHIHFHVVRNKTQHRCLHVAGQVALRIIIINPVSPVAVAVHDGSR